MLIWQVDETALEEEELLRGKLKLCPQLFDRCSWDNLDLFEEDVLYHDADFDHVHSDWQGFFGDNFCCICSDFANNKYTTERDVLVGDFDFLSNDNSVAIDVELSIDIEVEQISDFKQGNFLEDVNNLSFIHHLNVNRRSSLYDQL